MSSGRLFVVSTPLGNLQDMTFRAVETLKSVSLIIAEDTRTSGVLLSHYGITAKTISYHKFNEKKRVDEIIRSLETGDDVALISDAGTPLLSDPGYEIVKECVAAGIEVVPIPGASSVLAALVKSGFNPESFTFLGFLPKKEQELKGTLEEISSRKEPVVVFESPQRVIATLGLINEAMPSRQLCVVKELTKIHEAAFRGTAAETAAQIPAGAVKGEFVIVFGPGVEKTGGLTDEKLLQMVNELILTGESISAAVKTVSEMTGVPKNRVYKIAHGKKEKRE